MPNSRLLTVKEVMKEYYISRGTLYNWIKRGCPVIRNNRIVRFDANILMEWFKKQ